VKDTLAYLESTPLVLNRNPVSVSINSLKVSNLKFQSDKFSMKPITLSFERGKKYAITGHSGSGKSTFFRMIDGSLPYESGTIKIDGIDILSLDISEYIFSVDQFEHLFQMDFINNITIFNSVKAEKNTINELLNKLNTATRESILTYKGRDELSGGEKQIIFLLRMLVANKPIILLDETYSSIDKKNIKLIKEFIMNMNDKIILEITHDTSKENLIQYDEIILMEDGEAFIQGENSSMIN